MRRTLLMIAAVALLLTQCRKPAVELPTAGPANENMVSMTVTVGHGGKTDITDAGVITWSENDKLYVGDGEKYIGCLELKSGAGSATGTFSGIVSTTSSTTFGFYYLGSNPPEVEDNATTVAISFASQTGVLADASSCHIGYGTAAGKVEDGSVILENPTTVTMTSKVAIAYFEFKKDDDSGYEGAITLRGTNICNSMTVGFNGSFSGTAGTEGNAISLTDKESSQKYVMLVPTGTGEETLEFGGGAEGSTKLYKGIEANKFYCVGAGEPIAVTVTPTPKPIEFTVDASDTKVKFAPGNLYWDGGAFRFEANQWSFESSWNAIHVSHFYWSATESVAYAQDYSDESASTSDVFFTNSSSFCVYGEDAGTWRTLSKAEWDYLLNTRTNASSLRTWKDLGNNVKGLVILPDGTENPSTVMGGITSTADLETYGAVFLPAAGDRHGTDVYDVGSYGCYWSSTPGGSLSAYGMGFDSGSVDPDYSYRFSGYAVRLVRE